MENTPEEPTAPRSEADAIDDISRRASYLVEKAKGLPSLLIHEGEVKSLEHLLETPRRTRTNHTFSRYDSLLGYVAEHSDVMSPSALYLDSRSNQIVAVIDDNLPGAVGTAEHVVSFPARPTNELVRWEARDGAWISQSDFVDLLEEGEADLHEPSASDLMTLASNLELTVKSKVVGRRNLDNGLQTTAIFEEEEKGEKTTRIPKRITIGIPLIGGLRNKDGQPYGFKLQVGIRTRVVDGKFVFQIRLRDLAERLEEAWDIIHDQAKAAGIKELRIYHAAPSHLLPAA